MDLNCCEKSCLTFHVSNCNFMFTIITKGPHWLGRKNNDLLRGWLLFFDRKSQICVGLSGRLDHIHRYNEF